ncbi:ribosome-associated heat shock protein Hsp15 [Photobacterium kishitanii]|uniref:Heat shock protein 15 n=1 Tax=Photobacterium kishitanii TaxID=318456 RepID=A0A2T3QTS0_9GAMM|nr:ribosome-associated heat shock protein Hsp15 [Photobacterium kishitanii]KJG09015.1 ribosome-associated heat shock protein Hsp15 [Photobacterium kishitanii]KJG56134.1 ribosome-associated heat shock protein Hsp15 [Photobacterium kishitanii]KJG59500.1 ribosome-associated heat shock protein Hsp15 [Photobacterium kishitanii]KJG64268.1 ribosome-associated heat shock protein Hsp15 [Photobacterium kishitanii]KJG68361.1 ribosome-associated heat shock protein Hsp15 [Photobacterium kishitanii]
MNQNTSNIKQVRLDKWLWAARFYKTRSIARTMIDGGKVQYNGQRSKPSKIIELGAMVKLRQGNDEKIIIIEQISDCRRGAPEAQLLYQETAQSIATREQTAKMRKLNAYDNPSPEKRPDKKQRRDIMRFKNINSSE